jgi:DNA-binding transcriptional regulator YdaS (Cro superfamily)
MGLLISGRRKCSAELAKRIEKATKGKVTRKDLRPDLSHELNVECLRSENEEGKTGRRAH